MYCDCCEEESKTTRNKIKQQPIYSTSQLVLLDVDIRRITISTKKIFISKWLNLLYRPSNNLSILFTDTVVYNF